MQTKKMTLATVQGKLNRAEMKNIMAGNEPATAMVCGTRFSGGQCYCDYCWSDTHQTISCDTPCPTYFCGS